MQDQPEKDTRIVARARLVLLLGMVIGIALTLSMRNHLVGIFRLVPPHVHCGYEQARICASHSLHSPDFDRSCGADEGNSAHHNLRKLGEG
jgi:hypothetical protein